jgi:hypothetical protein
MRKIIFHLETGECGSEGTENGLFPDDVTDERLNDEAWQRAVQHAESYGIYPESDLEDCSTQDYEELVQSGEIDNYSSNVEGWWEDYDPEQHDMLVPGGGEWNWEGDSL